MIGDFLGFSESDYAYNQTRAHSADIFFLKAKAWLYGITCTVAGFLLGNIMGVFDLNIMGFLFDTLLNGWGH
tara:strand:+ start:12256 stop:12471 length:216 start_codon:yes stop_codon:yes gene_type:complete